MKKASNARVSRRLDEMTRLRLDGAEWHDIREYVRSRECETGSAWELAPGEEPLSDSQIRRYVGRADRAVRKTQEKRTERLVGWHLARLLHIYRLAIEARDWRAALQALQAEADICGLYPPKRIAPTTPDGKKAQRLDDTAAVLAIVSRYAEPSQN